MVTYQFFLAGRNHCLVIVEYKWLLSECRLLVLVARCSRCCCCCCCNVGFNPSTIWVSYVFKFCGLFVFGSWLRRTVAAVGTLIRYGQYVGASKRSNKQAGEQASEQASKQASKQARKQASKQASKQAGRQASRQTGGCLAGSVEPICGSSSQC